MSDATIPDPCIRAADLELAMTLIEKERLICAGADFEAIMAQGARIEEALRVAARVHGLLAGQLQMEGV